MRRLIALYSWSTKSPPAPRFKPSASKSAKALRRLVRLMSRHAISLSLPKPRLLPHPRRRRRLAAPRYARISTRPRRQLPHTISIRLPLACRSFSTHSTSKFYLRILARMLHFRIASLSASKLRAKALSMLTCGGAASIFSHIPEGADVDFVEADSRASLVRRDYAHSRGRSKRDAHVRERKACATKRLGSAPRSASARSFSLLGQAQT